jgi:hypothetical protein
MSNSIFDQLTAATGASPHTGDTDAEPGKDAGQAGVHATRVLTVNTTDNTSDNTTAAVLDNETRTDIRLREVAQYLLASGVIEQGDKPNLYRIALIHLPAINAILEPLDLCAEADEVRGVLCLLVRKQTSGDDDEWSHPLVRKQRLTLEQSLLVAILRQHFVSYEQERGIGAGEAMVTVDELSSHLQMYLGDPGSEAKERSRTLQLLEQLKGHGLVTTPDSHERVGIRPLIAHLANPENLQALLHDLRQRAADQSSGTDMGAGTDTDNRQPGDN